MVETPRLQAKNDFVYRAATCEGDRAILRARSLPAITLAGAAEEILGKLVKDGGGVNALEEEVKDRWDLFQTVFDRPGDPSEFADLMNNPRNELKHRMSGGPLELNLEEEAVNLITVQLPTSKSCGRALIPSSAIRRCGGRLVP
jgi:hypothetical protein